MIISSESSERTDDERGEEPSVRDEMKRGEGSQVVQHIRTK